jgi:pilus assembly protein CpaD
MTTFARPHPRALGRLAPSLLGLALIASGCSSTDQGIPVGPTFDSGQFAQELGVEQARYRHTVLFATDSARLDTAEAERLQLFLQTLGVEPGDVVRLEGHADERAGDLYNLELSARRIESVREAVRAAGYQEVAVEPVAYGKRAPVVPGSTPEAWRQNRRVDVIVDRMVVALPACPDWSRETGTDFANLPLSNLGCGVRTNFGLMVADPRDLDRGRRLGPADGVKAAGAIERYRAGDEADLKQEIVD